jgi:intracellular septation protein A
VARLSDDGSDPVPQPQSPAPTTPPATRTPLAGQREPTSRLMATLATALASSAPPATAQTDDESTTDAGPAPVPGPTVLATAIGGVRGMIDSSLPAVVFVIVNAIGGLREAVTAAIAVGVVIFILRIVRREPVTQAFYGFIAVAVAAYLAARTGKAQAFFLPGIALNAIYGTVGLLSLIVGRPLAGYVIAALDTRYEHWRDDRPLRRAAFLATLTWTAVFALRVVVQGLLYLAGSTGWLAVAKIGMGWPLWGIALAITLWLLRRVRQIESDQTPGPDSEPSGSAIPPSNAAS